MTMIENEIICDDFRNVYPHLTEPYTVITDPPYNQNYHYDEYSDNLPADEYSMLLNAALDVPRSVAVHYPEAMINVVVPAVNRDVERVVSWVYPSNTPRQTRLAAWWGFAPDLSAVGQPYRNTEDKRIKQRIAEGHQARLYDWWEIDQVKNVSKAGTPHPCPIPYELAERLVLVSTQPDDLVVDPFAGSGTVLLAARNHGRRYVGVELSASYVVDAVRRVGSQFVYTE